MNDQAYFPKGASTAPSKARKVSLDRANVSTTLPAARAWASKLGCSVAELRIAVRQVGPSVEAVQRYLEDLKQPVSARMPL